MKPHLTDSFKLSPDPLFIEKVRDVVGSLREPARGGARAVRGREDPDPGPRSHRAGVAVASRRPERRTHDYVRNGTTNLYAALDVASGNVIADLTDRHRAVEFRRFLNLINRCVPDDLDVHLIVDNSSTHKTPRSTAGCCVTRASRFTSRRPTAHGSTSSNAGSPSSPTSGSAAAPTAQPASSKHAIRALDRHLEREPTPFVWHKTADEILDTLARILPTNL